MIAAALVCLVVGVTDGDTLKARCGEPGHFQQVTFRLAEIDAPEKRQAFGQQSKQGLSSICFGKRATIQPRAIDRYGRTVARVSCEGEDASASQVRKGLAWAFTRYLTDPEIKHLELAARSAHVGLWADPDAVPPWAWRRTQRKKPARGGLEESSGEETSWTPFRADKF